MCGRYYFNTFTEESFAKAFVNFHSAIAADPEYAHAYAGIADYYNWLGILGVLPPKECFLPALEAARRAVELDENLSEAHASLGFSLHAGNYEWSRAEHHLLRAIELNPSNASAHVWYSIVMYTEGRFAEGLQYAQRSVAIDPLTPFNHHNIAWGLYFARRYDEAVKAYRKVISDFPTYSFGYYGLSKIQRQLGETSSAIRENDRAMELMGNSIFSLLSEAECFAADGQRDVAYKKLAQLLKLSDERHVSPYQRALTYCYLKEPEKAIAALQEALEIKDPWLNWMGVEPVFDMLRGNPRFEAILENTGYRPFFNSFSASDMTALKRPIQQDLHNLTTLVIDDGEPTSDGTVAPARWRPEAAYVLVGLLLISLLSAAAFGVYWYRAGGSPANAPARMRSSSIVVLPFSSEDPGGTEIGVGFADALTNKLGNIKRLQVISGNTGRALAGAELATLERDLGISYVLRGTVRDTGQGVAVSAELVYSSDGQQLFAEEFLEPSGDLFALQTKIAEKVWTALGIDPLPLERQQVEQSYTQNVTAYNLYLKGRSEMTDRSVGALRSAAATFSEALRLDPDFALANVGLADAMALLNLYSVSPPADAYNLAKRNIAQALAHDPNLAEAHAISGYIEFFHDRDRAGSELEFRRAIQVNPSYAPAHHWFALTLSAQGEKVDAETEIELAKRLDPRAPAIRSAAGVVHFHLGNLQRAIAECDDALAMDPRAIPAYKVKRWAYTVLGNAPEAADAFAREVEFSGGNLADPGWVVIQVQIEAISGNREFLLGKLERAVKEPSVGGNYYGMAYEIALAYNALGRGQSAMDWLERSEAAGGHSISYTAVDPRFANLRNDPRFTALLEKLN